MQALRDFRPAIVIAFAKSINYKKQAVKDHLAACDRRE
jgi:hypothetical protein